MTVIAVLVAIVSVAVSALMIAAVGAVPLVSRQRARRLVESGRRGATHVEELQSVPSRLRGAAELVAVAGCVAAALAGGFLFASQAAEAAVGAYALAGSLAGGLFGFAAGVALPRTVAVQNPEGVALAAAPAARVLTAVAYPVAGALAWPLVALMRLVGGPRAHLSPWTTEEESPSASGEDSEDAARDEAEDAFIEAVTGFAGKVVREVMVPRTDMVCLSDTATADEAVAVLREAGFSRLPVYHETLDDIRGVVYAKDLLLRIAEGGDVVPVALAREALYVPETKPVDELLVEMRRKAHIAIVADEYGGTAGLVTIEDLIEEIVGEIFDEYDQVETLVFDLGGGDYRIDARLPVDDLNDLFGTRVQVEADTVGGLVAELAGRIPDLGDVVQTEGVRLVVDELEGARIMMVTAGPANGRNDTEER